MKILSNGPLYKNLLPIKDIKKHSHPVLLTITLKFNKDSILEKSSEGTR